MSQIAPIPNRWPVTNSPKIVSRNTCSLRYFFHCSLSYKATKQPLLILQNCEANHWVRMKKLKLFQHVRVCDRSQKQKDQMQITVAKYYLVEVVNPLTPISDEDRISPNNINTISSRQVVRIKKYINLGYYYYYWVINLFTIKFSELTL